MLSRCSRPRQEVDGVEQQQGVLGRGDDVVVEHLGAAHQQQRAWGPAGRGRQRRGAGRSSVSPMAAAASGQAGRTAGLGEGVGELALDQHGQRLAPIHGPCPSGWIMAAVTGRRSPGRGPVPSLLEEISVGGLQAVLGQLGRVDGHRACPTGRTASRCGWSGASPGSSGPRSRGSGWAGAPARASACAGRPG